MSGTQPVAGDAVPGQSGPGGPDQHGPERLDQHLVRAGLARSRNVAQRLVRAGRVQVGGVTADKPSYAVAPGQQVTVAPDDATRWVGRGALKLDHALSTWAVDVTGRRCLDVGASTGGFTQVLLTRGAAHVTALDVGHGQLVEEIAADPRVTDLPGTNIRDVTADRVGTFDVVVGDVSFISLRLVLPAVAPLADPGADIIFLVKPQFEVGKDRLGRGGLVTEVAERARALREVVEAGTALGWRVHGIQRSPVSGTHGNTEYLLWLAGHPTGMMEPDAVGARIHALTREDD